MSKKPARKKDPLLMENLRLAGALKELLGVKTEPDMRQMLTIAQTINTDYARATCHALRVLLGDE